MSRQISLFDVRPILGLLDRGEFFVTPNQRLASRISTAYAIHLNQTNDIQVLEPPNVNSLQGWIDQCWRDLICSAFLPALKSSVLSPNHEQVVWERIVSESSLGQALLRPSATAAQAAAAYRTLLEWDQDVCSDSLKAQFNEGEDSAVFLSWINQFELMCKEHSWITRTHRTQIVIDAFNAGDLERPESIYGIAFESIAPLYNRLLNSAGKFNHVDTPKSNASVDIIACDTGKIELLAAAIWAKSILENNKSATVAIVIPDLAQQRQDVQRVLQEVFEPEFNKVATTSNLTNDTLSDVEPRKNLPFNLSAGYPLLEAPIISAALDILSLQVSDQNIETLETITQSPFYGLDRETDTAIDFHFRSRLMSLLRMEKADSISFARFRQLAEKTTDKNQGNNSRWYFPELLQSQANLIRDSEKSISRLPTEWTLVFQSLLADIGWPGNRVLDSIEYQQVSQWQSVMAELSNLELVLDPL
ncbi:MAG: ATP-dependent helicase/nuclease subunit B, partial [Oceanicoccus sp.]